MSITRPSRGSGRSAHRSHHKLVLICAGGDQEKTQQHDQKASQRRWRFRPLITPALVTLADNWREGHTHAAEQHLRKSNDIPVGFRDRLKHLTWAWFTSTMSTGGLSILLKTTPHQFSGLETIGKVLFILDVVLFLSLIVGISIRFITTPAALETSLLHPTEGLFFPCFLLSISTIISEAALYGIPSTGPWLPRALHAVFWVYLGIATLSAILQFFVLFAGENLPLQSMTPAWVLPIFPAMLVGSLASTLAPSLPADQRIPVLVAGVTCQGLGLTIALLLYPLYFGRLMRYGLPAPSMRPGMFIPVGQMGYTALALIGMSRSIPEDYGYFAANPGAVSASRMLALWVAIWLWMLGFWFSSVSFIATATSAASRRLDFNLTWWASVFPNIGWTLATIEIGRELESPGVLWVSSAMTVLLAVVWCFVFAAHVRAVFQKKILYPVSPDRTLVSD